MSLAPSLTKRLDGGGVRAIAFKQTIGDVDPRRHFVVRQKSLQKRRRAGAVDVVIAEDRNGLLRLRSHRRGAMRPCPCHADVLGSGISALSVGSRNVATSSRPTPRAASTRPINPADHGAGLSPSRAASNVGPGAHAKTKPRALLFTPRNERSSAPASISIVAKPVCAIVPPPPLRRRPMFHVKL